jgi:hypothetical protein
MRDAVLLVEDAEELLEEEGGGAEDGRLLLELMLGASGDKESTVFGRQS